MAKITELLAGKEIDSVWKNDELLVIRCVDSTEIQVSWVDEKGVRLQGQPKVEFAGKRIIAQPTFIKGVNFRSN